MSKFKSQQSAHNWLKQGKVIKDELLGTVYYYKLFKNGLAVYDKKRGWLDCKGMLSEWFDPYWHPFMKRASLKDIPNYNKGRYGTN